MAKVQVQLGEMSVERLAAPAGLVLTAILCVGCANPGPPKPPSLQLPAMVKDLAAERIGDHVELRWTTPSKTTDEMDIGKGAMTAEICREVGARPLTPAARRTACAPVRRLAVDSGPSEVSDTLPAQLQTGPPVLLTYRVRIYNSTGHSAGDSIVGAFAAAGTAPPAVEGLRGSVSEAGAILEWHSVPSAGAAPAEFVDLRRIDLSTPPVVEKRSKPGPAHGPGKSKSPRPATAGTEQPDEVHLQAMEVVAGARHDTAGTVDASARMGDTYSYVAERVRTVTVGSHVMELHSEPSSVVTLAMRDTFPPKSPVGLETVPGKGNSIDLSWEPNSEPDLAGYLVYRQLARLDGTPEGPLAKLTPLPITTPAYRDVAVQAGQRYIYDVTAVDASGNESAPSAKAQEVVDTPQ